MDIAERDLNRGTRNRKGFTLLELMIAIVMTALIAGIMGSAIRLGMQSTRSVDKRTESFERFRMTLSAIDDQVQSQIPVLYNETEKRRRVFFSGHATRLEFASNYSIYRGGQGYVIASYSAEKKEDGRYVLQITERIPGSAWKKDMVLLKHLDDIHFEYFHRDNHAPNGLWSREWTDPSGIPEKIVLYLLVGTNQMSVVMPMHARAYFDWIWGAAEARR